MTSREHPSSSEAQSKAEATIVAAAARQLGVDLVQDRAATSIDVGTGRHVKVDAASRDGSTVLEAYARQGKLKGGQLKKIAQDVLKLALVRAHRAPVATRAIIAFASEEARLSISGWVQEAADRFEVELIAVEIPPEVREMIVQAQRRQVMVNLDVVADDLTLEGIAEA